MDTNQVRTNSGSGNQPFNPQLDIEADRGVNSDMEWLYDERLYEQQQLGQQHGLHPQLSQPLHSQQDFDPHFHTQQPLHGQQFPEQTLQGQQNAGQHLHFRQQFDQPLHGQQQQPIQPWHSQQFLSPHLHSQENLPQQQITWQQLAQQHDQLRQQNGMQQLAQPNHELHTDAKNYQQVLDLQRYVQQEYARPFSGHQPHEWQQQAKASQQDLFVSNGFHNAPQGNPFPPVQIPVPFSDYHARAGLQSKPDDHSGIPIPTSKIGNHPSALAPSELNPNQQGHLSAINTQQGGAFSSYRNIQGNNHEEEDAPHETDDEGDGNNNPVNNQPLRPVPFHLDPAEHRHGPKRVKVDNKEQEPPKQPRRKTAPKPRGRPKKNAANNGKGPGAQQPNKRRLFSLLGDASDDPFVDHVMPPAQATQPAPFLGSAFGSVPGSGPFTDPYAPSHSQGPQFRIINPEQAARFQQLPPDWPQAAQSGRVGPYIDGEWIVRIESHTGHLVRLARREFRPLSRRPGPGPGPSHGGGGIVDLEEVWTHPETGQDLRQVPIPTFGRPVMGPDGSFHGFDGSVEAAWLFG
ncbi:hypothetical protein ACRALDRAFT_1082165 [Sodiomyces alcalophilus JCM 7366]|uniref:uncharacterized protein n=1 Tax=Sodiomyces alcalophilus JCM 7366 TaxID=591952 RepID=UPI0039B46100